MRSMDNTLGWPEGDWSGSGTEVARDEGEGWWRGISAAEREREKRVKQRRTHWNAR